MTPEGVIKLWRRMSTVYRTTVVEKRSAPEMVLLSKVLPTPNFLDGYVTTIGRRIYVPFAVGDATSGWSLDGQAAVCAHEHQHVEQLERDGLKYLASYAFSTAARARYEVEAYRTTLEVRHYLGALIGDAGEAAEKLWAYGCKRADVEWARATLRSYRDEILTGRVTTVAAKIAIAILETQ